MPPADDRLDVLVVGVVSPPETFVQRRVEALAARGFKATVAVVVPDGESQPRLSGVKTIAQPSWAESRARMLAGVVADGLRLAARSPRSLPDVMRAARADSPALRGHHPRAMAALPREAGPRRRWMREPAMMVTRLRLYLRLAHLRPDIVHFEWNSSAITYLPLARVWRCPTVVSCHGSEVNVRPHLSNGREFALRLRSSFQQVSAVHCVSEAMADQAAKHGMDPGRSWLIRPGVDSRFFRPGPHARPARSELRAVSVGVLRWLKGHEYAIRAISRLVESDVPIRLDVMGEDPPRALGESSDRERLECAIEQLGLQDHVRLHGPVRPREIRRRLQSADVLLHTSLSEGIPTAILEAMASGLPVVATDCGGVREAVGDGVEGFVLPVRAPAEAAAALRVLHEDPRLRARMGAAGRARVVAQFSLHRQIDGFAALYDSLIAPHSSIQPAHGSRPQPPSAVSPPQPRRQADEEEAEVLRLLSLGPLSWTQGLEDALQAMHVLLHRGIAARYRIVGDGDYVEALHFARHQLGLEGQVEFLSPGNPDHWPAQTSWADVLLDLSVRDTPRHALAHARASGLRIVTTATGFAPGRREASIHGVPRRDPHAAAEAVAALMGSPAARHP
jgi:glycosyltransferase involved in cell wall biosynthesis